MPKEITVEDLEKILPRTLSAYVKRSGDHVKYKLRTKKTLYTIKTDLDNVSNVEKIISAVIDIEELD